MKKLLVLLLLFCFAISANAQTKYKVKKTSSPSQQVHNVFHKRKRHNGYIVKSKVHGRKHKKVVKYKHGHKEVHTSGAIIWNELNVA